MHTYIVSYKQFPKERRAKNNIKIEARSRKEAKKKFLSTVKLARGLAKEYSVPFWLDKVSVVSVFKEG